MEISTNKEMSKVCMLLSKYSGATEKQKKTFRTYAKTFRNLGKKQKPIHKKHANERKTVCGILYDNTIMHKFIPNQLAGHWRRVTCKNCLKLRDEK